MLHLNESLLQAYETCCVPGIKNFFLLSYTLLEFLNLDKTPDQAKLEYSPSKRAQSWKLSNEMGVKVLLQAFKKLANFLAGFFAEVCP